ncbi:MAG: hypothetical protein KGM42_14705 [Hyphomicrobiales bacterium]|nr:hypothetical protein [Hyphomicrobiales bacterium]
MWSPAQLAAAGSAFDMIIRAQRPSGAHDRETIARIVLAIVANQKNPEAAQVAKAALASLKPLLDWRQNVFS